MTDTRKELRVEIDPEAPTQMYAVPELVTPEQARKWRDIQDASEHFSNRTLSERTVERYAGDMRGDRWVLSPQPISITPDGLPVDGQHRLEAVARTGIPQWFLVAHNVPEEIIFTIDEVYRRTFGHIQQIMGQPDPTARAAIVRMAARAIICQDREYTISTMIRGVNLSNPQLSEWEGYLQGFSTLNTAMVSARKLYRPIPKSATGALHLLISRAVDEETALEFCERLATGENLDLGDPRLALKNTLAKVAARKSDVGERRVRSEYFLCLMIEGFNAYARGETIEKDIKFDTKKPIPKIISGNL